MALLKTSIGRGRTRVVAFACVAVLFIGYVGLSGDGQDESGFTTVPETKRVISNVNQAISEDDGARHNNNKASSGSADSGGGETNPQGPGAQTIHWIFTTDCSLYQFNQGNVLLTSAYALNISTKWTWIMYGCTEDVQFEEMKKLGHPEAAVFFVPPISHLVHPDTGEEVGHFQASNRPYAIQQWWAKVRNDIKEEVIALIDPDQVFLRPFELRREMEWPADVVKNSPDGNLRIPSMTVPGKMVLPAVLPGIGGGAFYNIGSLSREDNVRNAVCKAAGPVHSDAFNECLERNRRAVIGNNNKFHKSGPPWLIHRQDADKVFPIFLNTTIRVHELKPVMLAEQHSFGISQLVAGPSVNYMSTFFVLSNVKDHNQPWPYAVDGEEMIGYDPCETREALDYNQFPSPITWHSCSSYIMPKEIAEFFGLHKDHIAKDIFDCEAPLLNYPPRDALKRVRQGWEGLKNQKTRTWETWSVCNYVNLWNKYVAMYKTRHCPKDPPPNLEHIQKIFPHAAGVINKSSRLGKIFRNGGWKDNTYCVQGRCDKDGKKKN